MDFRLRDASPSDLPRLQEVFRLASLSNEDDRAVLLDHPEALVFPPASLSTRRVRVPTVDPDLVVGFATTAPNPDGFELVDLFTDPEWTGRGVATKLIDDVVAFAAGIGAPCVSVVGNSHAACFYRRVGFVSVGHATTDFGQVLRMRLATPG